MTSSPSPELLGREREWLAVLDLLASVPAGPAGLLIEGEAGIGKTALLLRAGEEARTRGIAVLLSRPTGTEAAISYGGLLDLLDSVTTPAFAELPEPQRRALDVALRQRVDTEPVDHGVVSIATLSVLRSIAVSTPVLVAIDDVHALDAATRRVVGFVVRRLGSLPVGVVATRRADPPGADPLGLVDALGGERVRTVTPAPLSVGALHRMISRRLGVPLARPLVVRIHGASGGNPHFGLEIARELLRRGQTATPGLDPMPLPSSVQEAVTARLVRLRPATREVVNLVALMERAEVSRLVELEDAERVEAALDEGIDADVLVVERSTVRFTHPTVGAAAARSLPIAARRALHRRLAASATDPEERAHHLARATIAPDPGVARQLDAGADAARARGAADATIALRERSLELTPESDAEEQARRSVALADILFEAGDTGRSRELLEGVLAGGGAPVATRLEAAILLGTIRWFDGDAPEGTRVLERALQEARGDRAWEARLHGRLAWLADHDLRVAAYHGREAIKRLDPGDNPGLYGFALLSLANAELLLGRAPDFGAVRRGADLQSALPIAQRSSVPAIWAKFRDDFDTARAGFAADLERTAAEGNEASSAQLLGYLSELETWAGNLGRGRELGEAAVELARLTGQHGMIAVSLQRVALVDAIQGRIDAAVTALGEMRRLHDEVPDPWIGALIGSLGTFVELSRGDYAAADRAATEATALLDGIHMREPAPYRYHADQIEAVIELGERDRAEALLSRFEERQRIFPRAWIAATSARCRALLSAATGDPSSAGSHLDRALAAHDSLPMPLERVRTLIVGARVLRRANRRKQAHELAVEAARVADDIGAAPWAARARAEAERLGLAHGSRDELTPSERRIAELAVDGLTNREIAERLLISPKTVEASLARTYGKLGIRARAQLHERLRGQRDVGPR